MDLRPLYLDWSRPLVDEAARRLAERAEGKFPADFGKTALLLPTAEAGRRLRTALLEKLADRGGITRLRIYTAEALFHPADAKTREADDATVLAAWSAAIGKALAAEPETFGTLFPSRIVPDLTRSAALRIDTARRLQSARIELAGAGWSVAGARSAYDTACRENGEEELEKHFCRFDELAKLEKYYRKELARRAPGAADPADAVLAAIAAPQLPPEVETLIVIDSPHLGRGAVQLLKHLTIPVEIWINAPEGYAEHFDEAGRPEPEFWHRYTFPIDLETQLRFFLSPEAQACKLYSFAAAPQPPAVFGVLDPEIANALRAESGIDPAERHPVFFWPQPRPLALQPWSRLALTLLALGGSDDPPVTAVEALFAGENFRRYVCGECNITDWQKVLEQSDTLRSGSFAATLGILRSVASALSPLREVLSLCLRWNKEIRAADSPIDAIFRILHEIGSVSLVPEQRAAEAGDLGAAARLADSEVELSKLRRCAAEVRRAAGDDRETAAALFEIRLADTVTAAPPPPAAIELVGFAELNWRRERSLTIAGFNEEFFHPSDGSDPLLPETARRLLGMTLADDWHAIDALRFAALCASRDLRLLLGRSSSHGDALKPPRLLLQLPKEKLPDRIRQLFTDELLEKERNALPVPPAPWLKPRKVKPEKRISITSFKTYLGSPFRFYLEKVLGAAECDERAFEMDDLQFGTLVHDVLEEYANAVIAAQEQHSGALQTAEAIRVFCCDELEDKARKKFGAGLGGGIPLMQLELIRDSLRYFAAAEVAHRAEGWRILSAEKKVQCGWQELYLGVFPEIGPEEWRAGIILSGKIDRVDFRPGDPVTGTPDAYMIIDYKTSAKGVPPHKTHFGTYRDDPPYLAVGAPARKNTKKAWTDLQLPLYRLLLAAGKIENILPAVEAAISTAYFNLPLELTATGLAPFAELDGAGTFDSALRCADEVLRRIFEENRFGPPDAPAYFAGASGSDYRFDNTTVMPPEYWQEGNDDEETDNHE